MTISLFSALPFLSSYYLSFASSFKKKNVKKKFTWVRSNYSLFVTELKFFSKHSSNNGNFCRKVIQRTTEVTTIEIQTVINWSSEKRNNFETLLIHFEIRQISWRGACQISVALDHLSHVWCRAITWANGLQDSKLVYSLKYIQYIIFIGTCMDAI